MKIVIENTKFDFNVGCRLLKLKHEHSPYEQLNDIWNDIQPMSFSEIAQIENIEERRVAILCLGLERLSEQVKPKVLSKETIEKVSNFIDSNGNLVKEKYNDTYELCEVKGEAFGSTRWGRTMEDCHFVRFKDTSTDRRYMIWVDLRSVYETNRIKDGGYFYFDAEAKKRINAIQCIAWTIQTNVALGNVKEILRQGDCVFVKPIDSSKPLLNNPRHLTEKEYRKLLKAES